MPRNRRALSARCTSSAFSCAACAIAQASWAVSSATNAHDVARTGAVGLGLEPAYHHAGIPSFIVRRERLPRHKHHHLTAHLTRTAASRPGASLV